MGALKHQLPPNECTRIIQAYMKRQGIYVSRRLVIHIIRLVYTVWSAKPFYLYHDEISRYRKGERPRTSPATVARLARLYAKSLLVVRQEAAYQARKIATRRHTASKTKIYTTRDRPIKDFSNDEMREAIRLHERLVKSGDNDVLKRAIGKAIQTCRMP